MHLEHYSPYVLRTDLVVGHRMFKDVLVTFSGSHRRSDSGTDEGYGISVSAVKELFEAISAGELAAEDAAGAIDELLDRTRRRSGCCIQCDEFADDHAKAIVAYEDERRILKQIQRDRADSAYLREGSVIHSGPCDRVKLNPRKHPGDLHSYGREHSYSPRITFDPSGAYRWGEHQIHHLIDSPKSETYALMDTVEMINYVQSRQGRELRTKRFHQRKVWFCKHCCPPLPDEILPSLDYPACWFWPRYTTPHPANSREAAIDMRDWQANRCGICGLPGASKLDHDHVTGLIRGLLCHRCNTIEGIRNYQGGKEIFAMYRQINPATITGVQLPYRRVRNDPTIRQL